MTPFTTLKAVAAPMRSPSSLYRNAWMAEPVSNRNGMVQTPSCFRQMQTRPSSPPEAISFSFSGWKQTRFTSIV